jgi:hypothetical protein
MNSQQPTPTPSHFLLNGRTHLALNTLDAFRAEHQRLSSTWEQLDLKAQGNAAIAGVFLAGIFAYVTQENIAGIFSRLVVANAVLALICSVLFSIRVIGIREVQDTPGGRDVKKLADMLIRVETEEEFLERMPDFVSEQLGLWDSATMDVSKANEDKAAWLVVAQKALSLAIGLMAVLTLTIVIMET